MKENMKDNFKTKMNTFFESLLLALWVHPPIEVNMETKYYDVMFNIKKKLIRQSKRKND